MSPRAILASLYVPAPGRSVVRHSNAGPGDAGTTGTQIAVAPPSTVSIDPVANEDSSQAR